jgi:hypothetical protein
MVEEKMVSSSFGGAALGVSQTRAPMGGHLTLGLTYPCAGSSSSPTWYWGWLALTLGVGQAYSPTWGHLVLALGQTCVPRGAEVALPGRTARPARHMTRPGAWAALLMH